MSFGGGSPFSFFRPLNIFVRACDAYGGAYGKANGPLCTYKCTGIYIYMYKNTLYTCMIIHVFGMCFPTSPGSIRNCRQVGAKFPTSCTRLGLLTVVCVRSLHAIQSRLKSSTRRLQHVSVAVSFKQGRKTLTKASTLQKPRETPPGRSIHHIEIYIYIYIYICIHIYTYIYKPP